MPLPTRHRGGDKTKGDFQVQDSIKVQPHEPQFHWLGNCLALLEDLESIYKKKLFYCVTNGKELLLSKSFIVSSSKTPHKSCEGWR